MATTTKATDSRRRRRRDKNGLDADLRPLSQRSAAFDWRRRWFELSRDSDELALMNARDVAIDHKVRLIELAGPNSGAVAGYDPAGAGSPWFSIGPRNVNGRVKALAVHPTDPNTVYAGAASGGVWKSTDGGQTWDSLWNMQESLAVGAIAIAPSATQTVYVGSGEWTPTFGASYGGAGVYVSTDGGGTWSRRAGCLCRRIGRVLVHPTNPQRVWICGDAGLERTDDGGATWTQLRADTVTDIALDPASPTTLFIAIAANGLLKSTDSGMTAALLPGSPTGPGVTFPQVAIGVSGTHGHNFIVLKSGATVSTSINGGNTFTTQPGAHDGYFGWCDVVAVAPNDEAVLIYGGVSLQRSTNGGSTWTYLSVHADQHAAVFAPSNPNVVYFANDGGVWRSDDKGATVRKASNGLVITQFYNIGFWSPLSNVIGGGAQDNASNYTTSGLTWRPVWTNDGGWFVIDPTDPRTMYAEGQGAYLAKSTDGGATWSAVTAGISGTAAWEGVLTMDPNDHLRLYYGTTVVLRTLNGCATPWTTASQSLTGKVSAIAVAPSDSNRVYVGTTSGFLYRSDDGGNTLPWADKTAGLPSRPISSIYVDPTNRDIVLASVGGLLTTGWPGAPGTQSVYRSTTGGNSWTNVSGDLPSITANAVVADPSSATTFYVATDGGLYRTTNGGTNWTPFDNGIPNVPIAGLVVDPTLRRLYAGTFGAGAYVLDITPGLMKPIVDLYVRDDDLDTGQLQPSPSGLPDPLVPSPATADWWTSPDIKVNHTPFYAPAGSVFDGVDFDANLVHQDPHRTETNRIYVQLHNRGWQPTSNVSVRAFVADASLALPDLPNTLVPPAFNLSSTAVWTPVGPAQSVTQLRPNRPVVVTWDFTFPASTATHTCCLVVMSSADDPFTNTATSIAALVTGDKHAALKNLHVIDPGPAPVQATMVSVDIHNPTGRDVVSQVIVRPSQFDRGTLALLVPDLERVDRRRSRGVELDRLAPDDPIGQWYGRGTRAGEGRFAKLWRRLDRTAILSLHPTQMSTFGLRLRAGETQRAVLVCSHKRDVPTRIAPRITLEQRIGGKVIGGSTFQIGYDGLFDLAKPCGRQIRVLADRIRWREDDRRGHSFWLYVRRGANGEDESFRPIPPPDPDAAIALFEGDPDGSPLDLAIIGSNEKEDPRAGDVLWRHHLAHPIEPGRASGRRLGRGKDMSLRLRIVEVDASASLGAD